MAPAVSDYDTRRKVKVEVRHQYSLPEPQIRHKLHKMAIQLSLPQICINRVDEHLGLRYM